jgi:protein TonB
VDANESPVQTPSSVTPKKMARSLNSRPVAAKRTGMNQAEAPTLDAGLASPSANNSLAAVVGASNTLPPLPPSAVSHGGGVVKNPKLISSTPPVYPRAAMQAMVDGDVVIHAVIDKNGSVTEATVISGPMMLQNAALDAVRRWKYSPSTLNGEPVPADTTVTVKFRR